MGDVPYMWCKEYDLNEFRCVAKQMYAKKRGGMCMAKMSCCCCRRTLLAFGALWRVSVILCVFRFLFFDLIWYFIFPELSFEAQLKAFGGKLGHQKTFLPCSQKAGFPHHEKNFAGMLFFNCGCPTSPVWLPSLCPWPYFNLPNNLWCLHVSCWGSAAPLGTPFLSHQKSGFSTHSWTKQKSTSSAPHCRKNKPNIQQTSMVKNILLNCLCCWLGTSPSVCSGGGRCHSKTFIMKNQNSAPILEWSRNPLSAPHTAGKPN